MAERTYNFVNPGLQIAEANNRVEREKLAEQRRQFDVGDYWTNKQWTAQQEAAKQVGAGLGSLVNEYNRAFTEAKAGNEARYQQMLGIADQTTGQQQADVRSAYGKQSATGMQNLQRLGMANTTLAPTLQQGIQREESASLNRLADSMQQTKLGIIGGKKTDRELAPDSSIIQAYLQAASSTGPTGAGLMGGSLGGLKYGSGSGVATALPVVPAGFNPSQGATKWS